MRNTLTRIVMGWLLCGWAMPAMARVDLESDLDVAYREGHERWVLDLYRDSDGLDEPRAALVFVHGGGWRSGDKGQFGELARMYARLGYVTVTVNYRFVTDVAYPACLHDVKTAVRWLRANADKYGVDPNRIGIVGDSAGAHLASMVALTADDPAFEGDGPYQQFSSEVQSVLAMATPTDLVAWEYGRFLLGIDRGTPEQIMAAAVAASPITYVDAAMPAFRLGHGTSDPLVSYSQATDFATAAVAANAPDADLFPFQNGGHGVFLTALNFSEPVMREHFERTLRRRSPRVLAGPVVNPSNGHTYYLLEPDRWTRLEEAAERLGGHLASVSDAAENSWIVSAFAPAAMANPGADFLAIGLNDLVLEGSYEYTDGSPVSFLNWQFAIGGPLPEPTGASDDAVGIAFDEALISGVTVGTWFDLSISDTLAYGVVEVEPSGAAACGAADVVEPLSALNAGDLLVLIERVETGDLAADIDGSGGVDFYDMIGLLAAWDTGCP